MCGTVRNDKHVRKRAICGFHVSNTSGLLPFPPTEARMCPAWLPSAPRQCEWEGLPLLRSFIFFKECFPQVGVMMGELITSVYYPLSHVNDFLGPGGRGEAAGESTRRLRWGQAGPACLEERRCLRLPLCAPNTEPEIIYSPPELGIPGVFSFCTWMINEILLFHHKNLSVSGKVASSFSAGQLPWWRVRGE